MSRPTFIGIAGRSYTEPSEKGDAYLCPHCRNPFLIKAGTHPASPFGCVQCVVTEQTRAETSRQKREAKARKKAERDARARAMNPTLK